VLQAPSYHLIFEAVLIVAIVRLFFVKSYKPERTVLTEKVNFSLDCCALLLGSILDNDSVIISLSLIFLWS